jgi:hypothetical protein
VEGRVALEELLKRFPNWTVDLENAKLSSTSTVRGWDNLPAWVDAKAAARGKSQRTSAAPATEASTPAPAAPGAEVWEMTLQTPMGPQVMTGEFVRDGATFQGTMKNAEMGSQPVSGKIAGDTLTWQLSLSKPVSIKLTFDAKIDGNAMTGSVKLGMFGKAALTGKRLG